MTRPCCSGINGSHAMLCQTINLTPVPEFRCWQCGAVVPRDYAMLWSAAGCRCLKHEGDQVPPEIASLAEFPTVEDIAAEKGPRL